MHDELIKQHIKTAKENETFWYHRHVDAKGDTKEYNTYGYIWISYKNIRERLESILNKKEE